MTTLDDLETPLSKLETAVISWLAEALELRHGDAGDPKGKLKDTHPEGVAEVTDFLLRVRQRSDRVDELLAKTTRAKARARRAKEEAEFLAEQALYKATQVHAGRRVDFSAAREREADAKLDAFEERRLAHQANRLVNVTSEAYDVVNQVHWQLDAMRKDLRATLHAFQFESSLER